MIQDILKQKYGEYLNKIWVPENRTSIRLDAIIVKPEYKNSGIGTKIMNDLVDYAEKNKQIVVLTPASDYGGDKNRLVQFYKRFGFKLNKGSHKSYEFQDAMIRYPKNLHEAENFKGGLADNMTPNDIADKHDVPVSDIKDQLKKGEKVEMEHTNTKSKAKEIASDHLVEDPEYYDKLAKMEKNESYQLIKKLLRERIDMITTDETNDSKTFAIYYNKRPAGHITIGPATRALGEDTQQILDVLFGDDYDNINVATQMIHALWKAKPNTNRFVVSLPDESTLFWEKLGFTRLNDTFHMILRGH